MPIEVVFQIEHFRKSGACKWLFIPRTVIVLMFEKEIDSSLNCRIVRGHRTQQAQQSPCGLRGRAFAFTHLGRVVIGYARFPKSAITVLRGSQPLDRSSYGRTCINSNGRESSHNTAGSVHIIASPPSVPCTLRRLLLY